MRESLLENLSRQLYETEKVEVPDKDDLQGQEQLMKSMQLLEFSLKLITQ